MKRKVLITGAASGLGKALALHYAEQGCDLCLVDIDIDGANELVRHMEQSRINAFALHCDISSDEQVVNLVNEVKTHWSSLDILINNAGVATAGSVQSESLEQWQWVININLFGMVRLTKALLPLISNSESGQIINIASQAGITPVPMMASYNASKAAVVSFSETMHLELGRQNIRVSVACPSFFDTNLDKSMRSEQPGAQDLVRKLLSRGSISAQQVANIIATEADHGRFMILTHKEGKLAYRLKRFMPGKRYLAMMADKTRHFGKAPKNKN